MMENGRWGEDEFHGFSPTSAFARSHATTDTIVWGLLISRNYIIVPVKTHGCASLRNEMHCWRALIGVPFDGIFINIIHSS